jgi:hypothetical protein
MLRYLAPLGALLLLFASLAQGAARRETEVYNFQNGLSPVGALRTAYCGQNEENGTIYLGFLGITRIEPAIADATCDGLDNPDEGTADGVHTSITGLRPLLMRCELSGTLAGVETVTYRLRAGLADVPDMTCSLSAGQNFCEALSRGARRIPRLTQVTVRVAQASDNADDDSKCVVIYAFD